MADNQQNTSSEVDTLSSTGPGLVPDLNSSYVSKEQYSYARNAVLNTRHGDLGTISNEMSNTLCCNAPYKIVGTVDLPEAQVMVFSTDETNSEIGIVDIKLCTYTKVLNMPCLKFTANHPITGVSKKDFQKGIVVTFTDKHNPVRRIEVDKVGSITDCDDIRLFKLLEQPCIEVTRGQIGNMPNGVYSVAVAYDVNGQVFTDWFSLSNRTSVYSETSQNSLNVTITNLDTDFTYISVCVVGNYIDPVTKGATKAAKLIGSFSINSSTLNIPITDFLNQTYQDVPLGDLVVMKQSWLKAGIIANSDFLVLGDLVTRPEQNYQVQAMTIKARYIVEQVPASYYYNEGYDVSYYADENYDFSIEGVYNTGEVTDSFHIPGRKASGEDRSLVSSIDAFELDEALGTCPPQKRMEKWQVYNTASPMIVQTNKFVCNRRVLGSGDMGYFESTLLYPDNVDMFGKDVNTPIRYHKFPDESIVPRYSIVDGVTYINIKGVQFYDIPEFDDPDIVGYRILRSDRKNGNGTVIARGLLSNMRSYTDPQIKQKVLYSNYGVNYLGSDPFLSSTQTVFKNNTETNYTPLTDYLKDTFTFYSPHTQFEPKYSLGGEIKIEAEEIADVTGNFEIVYNHPRLKLLNQFSFWMALAIGGLETYFEAQGLLNKSTTTTSGGLTGQAIIAGAAAGNLTFPPGPTGVKTSGEAITLGGGSILSVTGQGVKNSISDLVTLISTGDFSQIATYIQTIEDVLALIANVGATIALSILSTIRYAQEILDIVYNFTTDTDYVYQYNSHALFNSSVPSTIGNVRRGLVFPGTYIPSDVVTVNDNLINNYGREQGVYIQTNKPFANPKKADSSLKTMLTAGVCDSPTTQFTSVGSAFYATSKGANPNQYGEIGSSAKVSLSSCVNSGDVSPILYGGDCIITRFQMEKRMSFFNQNMANANFPPDTEYDYRLYRNIAYPRFWLDSTKYDYSELLSNPTINFAKFKGTTTSKHNLDCKPDDTLQTPTRISNAYMYLFHNTVIDFFVECDFNINYREKTDKPFYSRNNTNLSQIFRSDRLAFPEEFNINRVYSDLYTTEIFGQQQRLDFDPAHPIPTNQTNSVIYSLPSFNLQYVDNWQYFLPANYFAFRESEFGELTNVRKVDQDRLIFLFSESSPYISMGRDVLALEGSGRKVTIGDGGLFAQDPREIMPTDNKYGACTSRYAFSNTHLGRFYPSENQGRIIDFSTSLDDITRAGMTFWCKNYMPLFLYEYFPTYDLEENPINGVGYQTIFDSSNETLYIIKRDFSPKATFAANITYNAGKFYLRGQEIQLRDTRYFNDISWTLSYSASEKKFISWHDWHPDWVIQTDRHFLTVKGSGIWKHNDNYESYCNFYGVDYPFEIEFVSSSGQTVETVRSIEYLMEAYVYKNNGRNRFHVLNQNFDALIVSNSEQISPLLQLALANPDPEQNLVYPLLDTSKPISYDITFSKVENKYRINQFWDATKDRGEFDNAQFHLMATDESGYRSVINPLAVDMNKPLEQRKRFRHYYNKFRLTKTVSGPNNMVTKLLNVKKLLSPR